MFTHTLSFTLAIAVLAVSALAQAPTPATTPPPAASTPPADAPPPATPATPLASKHFAYPSGIPYKADPDNLLRGPQTGYNICNSTTQNQNSLCQTSFVNSVDDFCLWAPINPDSTIADTEGEEVAWCTKPGHGTRLIPSGALTGVQFMQTPDYVQVVGFIKQSFINIQEGDYGGELDPHGADLRGNPLGGLMYSNAFPSNGGNKNTYQQVIEWHNFMGGDQFCIKACDPAGPNAAEFCQHIYDRIGCAYNAPNDAQNGVFESCQGADQDFPGIYTSNGKVMTYTQPPESLGVISTMPYQPRVPASSNCQTFQSAQLYNALPSPSATPTSSTPAAPTTKAGSASTGTTSRAAPAPAATAANGAGSLVASTMASMACVAFAILFFA